MEKNYFNVVYVIIFLCVFYISWWWLFKRSQNKLQ